GGDAAEDVDEHALDLLVAEDDVESGRHDLGVRTAPDIEEVRRLDAAVLLTGVRDDVEGRHHQAGTVSDDTDLSVELHVVQTGLLRLGLQRVLGALVGESLVAGVADLGGVVVERDLAVERDDVTLFGEHQRVDLDERGVLALVDLEELDEDIGDLLDELLAEVRGPGDLDGLGLVDAGQRVHLDTGERLGLLDGELLDLHAALDAAQRQVGAVRAVQEHREVELLRDACARGDHDALDDVTLDVQTQDRLGRLVRLVGGLGDLHATGLAAATGLDLSLHDDDAADLLSSCLHLLGGVGDDAGENRHSVGFEKVSCLVLVEIHVQSFAGCGGWDATEFVGLSKLLRPEHQAYYR